jgi:transposase
MYLIRQQSLFSLQDLLNLQPEQKYSTIFDTIDMPKIYSALAKKSLLGAPDRQNYPAIFRSVIIGMTEGFTTYEALLRRVRASEEYRWHCGFTGSNPLPNKTAYSRMFARLAKADALAPCFNQLIEQAKEEGFIDGKVIAIDSSHVHARDQFYGQQQADKPRRSRKRRKTMLQLLNK